MIAIIAGTGKLPIEACKSLKSKQKDFFVISLFPQDNFEDIRKVTKNIITQKVYKAGKILELLKEKKTTHVLLIGKVDKRNIFKKVNIFSRIMKSINFIIWGDV